MGSERKARPPNLDGVRLSRAVAAIGSMASPVTWASVIGVLKAELGSEYTRQALAKHAGIAAAYEKRRRGGVGAAGGRRVSEAARRRKEATLRSADRLAQVIGELEATRVQMARWAYNAYANGLDDVVLDKPLPPKDAAKVSAGSKGRSRDWRKRVR